MRNPRNDGAALARSPAKAGVRKQGESSARGQGADEVHSSERSCILTRRKGNRDELIRLALGIRERYLWELLSPDENDPMYKLLGGQFRSELHDRFMAPIYPFAFAALTFAFLGAPRTTRQSRNFSIGASILAVFGLRIAGFACSVMTVKTPMAALVQYLLLVAGISIGLWIIISGAVVEPSARLKGNGRPFRR